MNQRIKIIDEHLGFCKGRRPASVHHDFSNLHSVSLVIFAIRFSNKNDRMFTAKSGSAFVYRLTSWRICEGRRPSAAGTNRFFLPRAPVKS